MHDGLRIKASEALKHKFFDEIRESVESMLQEEIQEKEKLEAEI